MRLLFYLSAQAGLHDIFSQLYHFRGFDIPGMGIGGEIKVGGGAIRVENNYAVAQKEGFIQLVGDNKDGTGHLFLNAQQLLLELGAGDKVKRSKGFGICSCNARWRV